MKKYQTQNLVDKHFEMSVINTMFATFHVNTLITAIIVASLGIYGKTYLHCLTVNLNTIAKSFKPIYPTTQETQAL